MTEFPVDPSGIPADEPYRDWLLEHPGRVNTYLMGYKAAFAAGVAAERARWDAEVRAAAEERVVEELLGMPPDALRAQIEARDAAWAAEKAEAVPERARVPSLSGQEIRVQAFESWGIPLPVDADVAGS